MGNAYEFSVKLSGIQPFGISFESKPNPQGWWLAATDDSVLITVPPKSLSTAPLDLLWDFEKDMVRLADMQGVSICMDPIHDRLILHGTYVRRTAARAELKHILYFYFEGAIQSR